MNLLNTTQAADELGVTRRRVLALIKDGRLHAERIGRDHLIKPRDLEKVRDRPTGRPPTKGTKKEPKKK